MRVAVGIREKACEACDGSGLREIVGLGGGSLAVDCRACGGRGKVQETVYVEKDVPEGASFGRVLR